MSTTLFVTCGRGLSTSATQEIKEKIPNVCDIQPLGEGKLSFTINHIPCSSKPKCSVGSANEDEQHNQKEFKLIGCNEAGEKDAKFAKKQEDTEYINAIVPVYKLKLVERIFLLLHCEQFDSDKMASITKTPNTKEISCEKLSCSEEITGFEKAKGTHEMFSLDKVSGYGNKIMAHKSIIKDYENKLMYIIKSAEWIDVARRVQMLRNYQDLHAGGRVLCQNPEICPGSIIKRVDKQQLTQKHKSTLSLSGLTNNFHHKDKTYKRTQSFCPTEKYFGIKNRKRRKIDIYEGLCDDNSERETKLNCVSNQEYPSVTGNNKMRLEDDLLLDASGMALKKEKVSSEITESVKSTKFQTTVSCNNEDPPDKIPENIPLLVPLKKDEISPDSAITNKMVVTLGSSENNLKDNVKVLNPQGSSDIGPWEHNSTNHQIDMNKNEQPVSFRVSCRISGHQKSVLTSDWLTHNFVNQLHQEMKSWVINWSEPVLDFYVNITNSHFIIGLSLAEKSLSLRRYIPHLTVRSTICYLMAKLSQISPGGVLLDPMCGGGTILLEAATNFEVSHVIASDLSTEQLEVARCNLCSLSIPVSLVHAHAAALPLHSASVDAVMCDFPFGQKYKLERDSLELLKPVLAECQRVLVFGGRAVFLVSTQQHQLFLSLTSHSASSVSCNQAQDMLLTLERADPVSLGVTSAYVVVLLKEHSSKI